MADSPTLGEDLKRLEDIVRRLEDEDVGLESALELFEEGVIRLRSAQARLADAETRVSQVLKDSSDGGTIRLTPLE